jgi:hypothetical protein
MWKHDEVQSEIADVKHPHRCAHPKKIDLLFNDLLSRRRVPRLLAS